ncbi:hypothetical protein KBZ10_15305 [Streptomyces sp. F63]|uniref:hypothetical protein n=1 Tax=Streptomyces sp. F63 TaxID=2824887 RepID=UPI001B37449B|nr:hypothetical protein [Streptomyces sp. F63]MBQ0985860.1 hypothetical protein [Streptomyces sp. F63]
MSAPIEPPTTTAFFVPAALSSVILCVLSLAAMPFGIAEPPLGPRERGLLAPSGSSSW